MKKRKATEMKKRKPEARSSAKVYDRGNPDRFGVVIRAGEQVSEVRWDDGRTQFVSNNHLKEAKKKTIKG